ncbi:MAG TPA: ABC transporter ATP-binding protein [Acidimicrobiales bacterium]|nr:ABC transporter ATP-binding protein [Acidimicrobiales bacterium]
MVHQAPAHPALELRGVSKRYRQGDDEVVALDDVCLSVRPGELVALVGRSGSGKSTLLHVAGGLDESDAGEVRVGGTDIARLGAGGRARLRRRQVGFVFQFFQLIPSLTVSENVELPLVFDGDRASAEAAGELLRLVGLDAKADRYPGELSGGEMQRVAVARSLVARPALILADEPTGNLDSATGSDVLDLLTGAVRDCGAALVLATHDERAAARADRVLSIADGKLTAQ